MGLNMAELIPGSNGNIELFTERLYLRSMTVNDGPQIVALRNADHVRESRADTRGPRISLESHEEWFASTRESRVDLVIIEAKTGTLIGGVSADTLRCPEALAGLEMGKYIGSSQHLGKGFATEAALAWINYLTSVSPAAFLFSRTRTSNSANIRINLGLRFVEMPWPEWLNSPVGSWTYMQRTLGSNAAVKEL